MPNRTHSMPIADELAAIRNGFVRLARELGYKRIARDVAAGGPLERNIRLVRNTLQARKGQESIVERIQVGLDKISKRVRKLGGA